MKDTETKKFLEDIASVEFSYNSDGRFVIRIYDEELGKEMSVNLTPEETTKLITFCKRLWEGRV